MLDDKEINKIIELREKGVTIKDIAKTVGVSESTVKKYTSNDYEKDNEIDEKSALRLTKQMKEEGYVFDEIEPLMYSFKLQANEIDITLFDYLTDIHNIMNSFLKITNTPTWFYYVFLELANNLSVFTDHIDATVLMEAFDNLYNREIDMENAEAFISEIETKAENLVSETKAELEIFNAQILNAQKEHTKLTSLNTVILNKMLEDPDREKLKIAEENLKNMESELKRLTIANAFLIEKGKTLEQSDKDNKITKQENVTARMIFERINKLFPEEVNTIIQEIENEIQ